MRGSVPTSYSTRSLSLSVILCVITLQGKGAYLVTAYTAETKPWSKRNSQLQFAYV